MTPEPSIVERLYEALVEEVRRTRPELLRESFTVAEIYQNLVPYRTHRERVGAEMNGDYEHALLRLLAGEGGYVKLESDAARNRLEDELNSIHPDTGVYRNFAACEVRLRPDRLEESGVAPELEESREAAAEEGESRDRESEADGPAPDDRAGEVELEIGPEGAPTESAAGTSNGAKVPGSDSDLEARGSDDGGAAVADGNGMDGPGEGIGADEAPEAEPPSESVAESDDGEGGTCLWCRERLPDRADLRFCPYCGSDVELRPCPECGAEIEPDWIFCIACGAEGGD